MSNLTPAVAYYNRKILTTSKSVLIAEIADAPINAADFAFLKDVINGLTLKELSIKYNKSLARVSQWKRSLFERLHTYDMAQLGR